MNKLETAICDAVEVAQDEYVEMSGWWLHHAPESFLQIVVSQKLSLLGGYIYPDIQLKRIYAEKKFNAHGMTPKQLSQRPDISVWFRTEKEGNPLRAVIEVKRTYRANGIKKDLSRVKKICKKGGPKSGYVLAYSDAKSVKTLTERFKNWSNSGDAVILKNYVHEEDDEGDYWGFCLLKVK